MTTMLPLPEVRVPDPGMNRPPPVRVPAAKQSGFWRVTIAVLVTTGLLVLVVGVALWRLGGRAPDRLIGKEPGPEALLAGLVGYAGTKRLELSKEALGRFRIGVPSQMTAASRSQRIYGVSVKALPLEAWTTRMIELGDKVVSRPTLASGVEAVWVREASDLILEARQVRGQVAVTVVRDAPEGKEAVAERLSGDVLAAYVEGTAAGFCIGPGAIRMGPSLSESVKMVWKATTTSVRLEFSTQTVSAPDTKSFMDVVEERAFAGLAAGRLTVIGKRARTVAGMAGREIRISIALPDQEPQLRFTWHFAGVGRDGTKPKIDIVGTSEGGDQAALEAAWEAMLPSIETVPVE